VDGDRFPLPLVYVGVGVLGVAMGIWEAVLVPLRLPGGVEGLPVVLALLGTAGAGVAAAVAARDAPLSVMPGVGWLVAVVATQAYLKPTDEVIVPGRVGGDPGVGTVGTLFLFAGIAGTLAAVLLAQRFTRRTDRPTQLG
jgi:hypothetical protein